MASETEEMTLAVKELSLNYIRSVHENIVVRDASAFGAAALEYQRRRVQVEFDKYMAAVTAIIARTTEKVAKDALLAEMQDADIMHADIYSWATPTAPRPQSVVSVDTVAMSQGRPRRAPENMSDFDGSHSKWPAFRDLFKALVVDAEYSELECFLLLRKYCKGPSEEVVAGYAPVAASFVPAWESLKEIFEDKYSIVQALVDKLMELAPTKNKTVVEMRRVIDTFRSTLRQLESMGLQVQAWDAIMVNLLARKMPPSTVHDWEQHRDQNAVPSLKEFMAFLDGKARLRIFTSEYQGGFNRKQQPQGAPNGNTGAAPVTQNPFARQQGARPQGTGQQSVDQRNAGQQNFDQRSTGQQGASNSGRKPLFTSRGGPKVCYKCKADHLIYSCPEFTSITEPKARETFINKLGLCNNCFRPTHATNDCDREGCRDCGGARHNRSLCPKSRQQKRGAPQVNHVAEKKGRSAEE